MTDIDQYRKCDDAHDSVDAASAAVEAFQDAVNDLRVTYKIPSLVMMLEFGTIEADGKEGRRCADICFGDEYHWESLAGRLCGVLQASRQARMAKLISGVMKQMGDRP